MYMISHNRKATFWGRSSPGTPHPPRFSNLPAAVRMPTEEPPIVPDQLTLLLELLDGIAHDLGSTAGGLRMRAEALRLGASASGAEGVMRNAATGLACTQYGLRLLLGLQNTERIPIAGADAHWREAMAQLLPIMLGPGYALQMSAVHAVQTPHAVSALSASMLSQARAYRIEAGARGPLRTVEFGTSHTDDGLTVWLDVSAVAASSDRPGLNAAALSPWSGLAARIAAQQAIRVEHSGTCTRWFAPRPATRDEVRRVESI